MTLERTLILALLVLGAGCERSAPNPSPARRAAPTLRDDASMRLISDPLPPTPPNALADGSAPR